MVLGFETPNCCLFSQVELMRSDRLPEVWYPFIVKFRGVKVTFENPKHDIAVLTTYVDMSKMHCKEGMD